MRENMSYERFIDLQRKFDNLELKYLHLVNHLQDHMEIPEGAFVDKLLMKRESNT